MQIPDLSEAEIELLLQNLTPAQLTELETLLDVAAVPRITFEEYVNMALGYLPDGWQIDLIRRLQSVVGTKRRRILIHAPPRVGKSTIVRLFAAYMLGVNPLERVKYVCYNIERATEHSKAIRALVQDKTYRTYFPHTTFPKLMPSSAWYTIQRLARRDAEPSFQPLGLVTGFVGSGADTLLIDDPYSDAKDAMSTIYNESVRIFWQETTKPRILDGNVIVMFHRYSDIDFIAMLIEEGGWEQWIYSAIAEDSNDILGRPIGEQLTPRFGEDYFYNVRDQIPASTWEAQFQGRPYPAGGGLIKKEWFEIVDEAPPMRPQYIFKNDLNEYLNTIVMGVDLAVSSKNSADYTVAFPVGISNKGNFYVFRPYRAQAEWPDARKGINDRANEMNVRTIGMEANATQKAMADDLRHATKKNIIKVQPLTDKEARCRMWTPLAEMGRIILVEDGSGWTTECLVEFAAFPKGKNDDRIDALGSGLAVAGSGRWGEKLDITSAFKLT